MADKSTSSANSDKSATDETEQAGWAWPEIVGVQMNNVKTLGEISRVFARTAQKLASQQIAFMKANAEAMQNAASTYGGAGGGSQ